LGLYVSNIYTTIDLKETEAHVISDVRQVEAAVPQLYKDSAHPLPGSKELLALLDKAKVPWAIVTSGSTALVNGWLDVLNLPHPKHLVTAENVQNGKPDPACYELGRQKLGLSFSTSPNARILVLEDAPAGIKSGYGAGCEVLAVSTSHGTEQLACMPEAKWIVKDLDSVKFIGYDQKTGEVEIEIRSALRSKVESK
jgi:glycerol-1-phosphatase